MQVSRYLILEILINPARVTHKTPSILGKSAANRYLPIYSFHDSTGKKNDKLYKKTR